MLYSLWCSQCLAHACNLVDFENTFQIEMLELADRVKEILQFKKKKKKESELVGRRRNGNKEKEWSWIEAYVTLTLFSPWERLISPTPRRNTCSFPWLPGASSVQWKRLDPVFLHHSQLAKKGISAPLRIGPRKIWKNVKEMSVKMRRWTHSMGTSPVKIGG